MQGKIQYLSINSGVDDTGMGLRFLASLSAARRQIDSKFRGMMKNT